MEKKYLTLGQIGLYNPQRLNDETIENLFVVRVKFFQFLMAKLQKEKDNSIPQHHLIIAQRGMGKTTLLKRIEVELRKEEYNKQFIPLLFPEEQYNLKNLAEFWLNSLDALADTLEFEKKTEEVKIIDAKVKELDKIKNIEDLARESHQFLKSFTESIKRRPVLLIDNMSFIFDRLDKSEQHALRAWLMQNGAPIIIGGSAIAIEDTFDYDAPFYDAFQIHYLQKLSFEELIEILNNLAKLTNAIEVTPNIQKEIARIKTIHQLTGGNPRTAVMLFKLIVKGFAKEINDDLEALLDEITPIYKARFEELSTQMQIIVDAIALNWDPINLEQLREETRLDNHQLSPQLKRLVEMGWIERINAYQAKGNAYQISERFFNIWFLMRRSSRRQKKELYCLSKFLESFYGDELHPIALKRINQREHSLDNITYNLALAEVLKDRKLSTILKEKSFNELRELAETNPKILDQFEIPDIQLEKDILNKNNQYLIEIKNKNFLNAAKLLLELSKMESHFGLEYGNIYYELGNLYKDHLHKFKEAENFYLKSLEFNNKDFNAWIRLGLLYQNNLLNFEEAEKAFIKAINLEKNDMLPLVNLGFLYQFDLKKYNDAENVYLKATEFDLKEGISWYFLGDLYYSLKNYKDSEKAYLKSLEINKKADFSWIGLANLYMELKIYEKSEKAFLNAIAINDKDSFYWWALGNLYQVNLENYYEAEKAFLRAIKLDRNDTNAWNGLGNLYQDHLQKYTEAEKCYLKAIESNDGNIYPKYNLVFLYRDKMNKLKEAEELFRTVNIDQKVEDSFWLNKTLFELYKRNEGNAIEYFEKALNIIENKLPDNTRDDWWRFGAVIIKLGYTDWLLNIMEEKGFDIILSPYYVAIKAMNEKDMEGYLNSKAVEIREPAKKLIEIMRKY